MPVESSVVDIVRLGYERVRHDGSIVVTCYHEEQPTRRHGAWHHGPHPPGLPRRLRDALGTGLAGTPRRGQDSPGTGLAGTSRRRLDAPRTGLACGQRAGHTLPSSQRATTGRARHAVIPPGTPRALARSGACHPPPAHQLRGEAAERRASAAPLAGV